jgi:glycosyltransferase involved in cell wall biosynthesis
MKIKAQKYNWQYYKFGSISLCMIMRNEARVLPRCLDSVMGLVDEIVIVDTGSVDKSIEIAKSYGAKVLQDPWQDDFARPRNIGLAHATKQWILIMDPDEMILPRDHNAIRWLTRAKNIHAVWLTTFNYSPPTGEPGYRWLHGQKDPTGRFPGYIPSTKTRFFKNGLGIHFEGCWHELVDWYLLRHKFNIGKSPIPIHHWCHEINQASAREKSLFYLRLGEKKVQEWPTHGQAWWELAVAEMINGMRGRASRSIANALRNGFAGSQQYFSLARCQNLINNKITSRLAFEKGICTLFTNLTHIDPTKKTLGPLIEGL